MATGNFVVRVNIGATVASLEPRSDVALKCATQDTTQSHSPLAISKKKKDMSGGKEKGDCLFQNTAEDVEVEDDG